MALINCPECKQQISNKAEKCPNCGYKLKKKSGCGCWSIIGGIVLGIIVLFIIASIMTSEDSNGGVITDDRTYSNSWRSPQGSEYRELGQIIVKNGIKVCGEYYVKEVESNEFIIACSGDGINWEYFVVYKSLGKIYRANYEMESKLNPPR